MLSLKLFNLYTEEIFCSANVIGGCSVGGVRTNNLRYADDTALLAESEAALQELMDAVRKSGAEKRPAHECQED